MKSDIRIYLAVCLSFTSLLGQGTYDINDVNLSTPELIMKYGYPVEIHEITTEDGYILTMYRIPHGKGGSGVNKKPYLLMHGMFGQAENFIVAGIHDGSLAYMLADNDFDVWLGNTRGNQHGRRHVTLNPKQRAFWNFSFHEMGMYDLPAKIDYILNVTNQDKLFYTGHSQGGTIFYIMSSLKPEYQQKIALASLLAPGGFENHFTNPMLTPLASRHKELTQLAATLNIFELPPRGIRLSELLMAACGNALFRDLCIIVYHISTGGDPSEFNKEIFPLLLNFLPSASTKQVLHYGQLVASGHFRPWDYGTTKKNIEFYGEALPPDYPIRNITVPVAMYYSLGDNLAFAKDIENICDAMQNCVRKFLIPNKRWTHMDFVTSTNLKKQCNEPLLKFAQKYNL
ncbi:hypothetical protein WA026_020037 [Henosepilachna vigintioctopunctata]|uniref:Lipase n=1 Tax=Henosepilachna vigintioctopunctata TaxID=420089 RepID=A0AAW1UW75_9CUCU